MINVKMMTLCGIMRGTMRGIIRDRMETMTIIASKILIAMLYLDYDYSDADDDAKDDCDDGDDDDDNYTRDF